MPRVHMMTSPRRFAATTPPSLAWARPSTPLDVIASYPWELYNVTVDPTQSKNVVRRAGAKDRPCPPSHASSRGERAA